MGCAIRDGPKGPLVSPSVKLKKKNFALTLACLKKGKCSGKEMEVLLDRTLGMAVHALPICFFNFPCSIPLRTCRPHARLSPLELGAA
jgi:hypothetical protein